MKKMLSVVCCVAILVTILGTLSACGTSIQEEWETVMLGKHLPTPQDGKLRSGSNLDDIFMGGIENVSKSFYTEYKNACIEMGYTIESEDQGDSYKAFNTAGYELYLSYSENRKSISISLKAPLELTTIEWPTTGPGVKLPKTSSAMGKITQNSSSAFVITVGNMTMADYNNYVKQCEEKGFVLDYTKRDDYYEAKDGEGFRLNVRYIGCNRIEIMIQTPSKETAPTQPEATNPTQSEATTPTNGNANNGNTDSGVRKEFKDAMDGYEKFIDEYVAIVKKYKANPGDTSVLTDYLTYVGKYAEFVEDFEKWEDQDMNAAELAYYLEVQTRVGKKLLEAI